MCRVYKRFSLGFVRKNSIAKLTTNFNRNPSENHTIYPEFVITRFVACFFAHFYHSISKQITHLEFLFSMLQISIFKPGPGSEQCCVWMSQCQKMCALSVMDRYSYEWHQPYLGYMPKYTYFSTVTTVSVITPVPSCHISLVFAHWHLVCHDIALKLPLYSTLIKSIFVK